MEMKNKVLFIVGTHGDEKIGFNSIKKMKSANFNEKFDWIIGNPKAFAKNIRFINYDINRAAPGKKKTKEYEYRQAYNLIKIAKNYCRVFDIHGTTANCGIFTIITNPKLENLFLAASLPIKNIVIWVSNSSRKFGAITQFVNCGVEIECGPKSSKKIQNRLLKILKSIMRSSAIFDQRSFENKNFYQVYGKIVNKKMDKEWLSNLRDFKLARSNGEKFYPLLAGRYNGIACYKMKKINFWDIFAY